MAGGVQHLDKVSNLASRLLCTGFYGVLLSDGRPKAKTCLCDCDGRPKAKTCLCDCDAEMFSQHHGNLHGIYLISDVHQMTGVHVHGGHQRTGMGQ